MRTVPGLRVRLMAGDLGVRESGSDDSERASASGQHPIMSVPLPEAARSEYRRGKGARSAGLPRQALDRGPENDSTGCAAAKMQHPYDDLGPCHLGPPRKQFSSVAAHSSGAQSQGLGESKGQHPSQNLNFLLSLTATPHACGPSAGRRNPELRGSLKLIRATPRKSRGLGPLSDERSLSSRLSLFRRPRREQKKKRGRGRGAQKRGLGYPESGRHWPQTPQLRASNGPFRKAFDFRGNFLG